MSRVGNRCLVFGLGNTGRSLVDYLLSQSQKVDVYDTRKQVREERRNIQQQHLQVLEESDIKPQNYTQVYLSPGVDPRHKVMQRFHDHNTAIDNDITLFRKHNRNPVCAVTGSNGKSTVVSMIAHALSEYGVDAGLGGNIGKPAVEFLTEPNRQIYILELSSFQLEITEDKLEADVACILNVSEDHMDRYTSFTQYRQAKHNIYRGAKCIVANADDSSTLPANRNADILFSCQQTGNNIVGLSDGYMYYQNQRLMHTDRLRSGANHNIANILASVAILIGLGYQPKVMLPHVVSYSGLPNRFVLFAEVNGVRYINDSKATNVDSVQFALRSVGKMQPQRLILIAGGDAKNADLSKLIVDIIASVALLLLIGKDADIFIDMIAHRIPVQKVDSLEQAVSEAHAYAKDGDIVLLSPACSSLDMFDSYAHRGSVFEKLVQSL